MRKEGNILRRLRERKSIIKKIPAQRERIPAPKERILAQRERILVPKGGILVPRKEKQAQGKNLVQNTKM